MSRVARTLLAALALAAAGCSKDAVAPLAPPAPTPAGISLTQPAHFATLVPYDAPIWAQFDRPLDPASVDTTTVFLKVDTQRQPVRVRYETFSRRIHLEPVRTLALLTTYTVEFSPGLRDSGGVRLGSTRFFQFTTNSLRRHRYDLPVAGSVESPVASYAWAITGATGSALVHDLYASTDSAAVVARSIPPLARTSATTYPPRTAWPLGARVYWALTTTNTPYGERLDGPVQSFDVYPADWPIDSLVLDPFDWSGQDPNRFQSCQQDRVWSGPGGIAVGSIRFPLAGRTALRVASARLTLFSTTASADSAFAPGQSLWLVPAVADWASCAARTTGPPLLDPGFVCATGAPGTRPREIVYEGPALASYCEMQARRGLFYGPVLQSAKLQSYLTQGGDPAEWPRLVLRVFRPAAAVAAAPQGTAVSSQDIVRNAPAARFGLDR